jgi:glyoxylase-like metal-dependent hydrolase (beta-lactamase superfamily II)
MADPARLVASAARLYGGEEGLRATWGEVVPVPGENLRVLSGGESVLGYRVEYTPGHASHHVCFLHEESGTAFVGDMAGVRVSPSGVTLAPTPPPDIDVEAWERSVDVIAGWEPATLALTHFGAADDPPAQLAAVREALHRQAELASGTDLEGFMKAVDEWVRERAPAEDVPALETAAPLDHLYLGLERWLAKRG